MCVVTHFLANNGQSGSEIRLERSIREGSEKHATFGGFAHRIKLCKFNKVVYKCSLLSGNLLRNSFAVQKSHFWAQL